MYNLKELQNVSIVQEANRLQPRIVYPVQNKTPTIIIAGVKWSVLPYRPGYIYPKSPLVPTAICIVQTTVQIMGL